MTRTNISVYGSGREPMAREPDATLFKTASGSLARRQVLSYFLLSIAIQQILPLRPS